MTCVSTAQQPRRRVLLGTEPVDTKQPLSSLIGTFGIHPISAPLQRPKTSVGPLEISYLLGLDRHASAVYVSEQDVTCIHLKAATNVTTPILTLRSTES